MINSIRLRNLLDRGQAKLAQAAGLVPETRVPGITAMAALWRSELNGGNIFSKTQSDQNRLDIAYKLFQGRDPLSEELKKLLLNKSVMTLLTEKESITRKVGNTAAHGPIKPEIMKDAVERQAGDANKPGMAAILDFVASNR